MIDISLYFFYTVLTGSCGGYYAELSGTIVSPNYPGNYPDKSRCYYYIMLPMGYTITMTITEFKIETCCDYLKVHVYNLC